MGTAQNNNAAMSENNNIELYKNQLKYNKYIQNKKKVYAVLCFIAAIVNIINMIALPMFKYNVKGNSRKGIKPIRGEYTHTYIIQKYFENGLGEKNILNTCYIIILFAMIVLEVILVIGALVNLFIKKPVQGKGIVAGLLNYGMIEIYATVFLVMLLIAMICGKVDVSGGAENAIGFWVYAVSSMIMVCTSIPLSDK